MYESTITPNRKFSKFCLFEEVGLGFNNGDLLENIFGNIHI